MQNLPIDAHDVMSRAVRSAADVHHAGCSSTILVIQIFKICIRSQCVMRSKAAKILVVTVKNWFLASSR
jgi:hypothetical protein